ncbi:MAG: hypothetical protein PHC85_02035 [Candidatus Pacebacteria bacterium]|nr:hypothetical protein [Candidatus Paceibacterota bacterium]
MISIWELFSENYIFSNFLSWLLSLWFVWLPAGLAFAFWELWLNAIRKKFLRNMQCVLLEIKVPRDIIKSPKAMETVLNSLYTTFAGNWWARSIKGYLPTYYSLEMVGINGSVHFFIYTQKGFRNLVESQIYSQYPDAEISEVSDYSYASDFENRENWNMWGAELGLTKEDPYPLRTYIDFDLQMPLLKEEQKVNPIASFVEFLGSLKQGEQVWIQILIKGASGKDWIEKAKKLIAKLLEEAKTESGEKRPFLTEGERDTIKAIEKNVSKLGFETGIRIIYMAKKEVFNQLTVPSIIGLLNQYSSQTLNGFKPANSTASKQPFKQFRENLRKKKMLKAYQPRGYFYRPNKRKHFVLNTEELATIYHFPGRVAETPTFARVETKKGEPPAALPI